MFDPTGFTYNSETGEILKHGKKCGSVTKKGYLRIQNKGDRIQAHRLAWRLFHGRFPVAFLDHINGDRLDNRMDNLRLSSPRLNGINKDLHRNGRLAGFSKQPNGKFRVQIWFQDKRLSLGNYETAEEAGSVYDRALAMVLAGNNPLGTEPALEGS